MVDSIGGGSSIARSAIEAALKRHSEAVARASSAVESSAAGAAPTADFSAAITDSLKDASASVQRQPELTYAIARLLARRLSAVTAYLVDIKRQYADSNTHLALMDQVLANVIAMNPNAAKLGSERDDVPDY